eukprot:9238554-Alexandrium_andersonii.AAC.1
MSVEPARGEVGRALVEVRVLAGNAGLDVALDGADVRDGPLQEEAAPLGRLVWHLLRSAAAPVCRRARSSWKMAGAAPSGAAFERERHASFQAWSILRPSRMAWRARRP